MTTEARIFGLGTRVPQETTIETLMALEECRAVYSGLKDKRVEAWLKKRVPGLKPLRSASELVDAAKKGGPVGLAVWGHPQFSSALAREAQALLRKAGVECRVYGAVSPIGSSFARSVSFLGGDYGYQGAQAYELSTLLADPARWTPRLPLVAYAETAPSAAWKSLQAILAAKLDGKHELRVYPIGTDDEKLVPLSRFPLAGLDGAVVLVPPAGGAPKRPHDMAK
jgi:hypothetical protein